ncbi:hypothetical protein [Humibacter soli]
MTTPGLTAHKVLAIGALASALILVVSVQLGSQVLDASAAQAAAVAHHKAKLIRQHRLAVDEAILQSHTAITTGRNRSTVSASALTEPNLLNIMKARIADAEQAVSDAPHAKHFRAAIDRLAITRDALIEQVRLVDASRTAKAKAVKAAESIPHVDWTENIWATGYGTGDQNLIDQCNGINGGVNITPWYLTPTIAQDMNCGGHAFPDDPGAIVRVTGPAAAGQAGLYQVLGVVTHLNAHTQTIADVPHGYDLLYQTCITGSTDMALVALKRIN